jgi:hypothetical protein
MPAILFYPSKEQLTLWLLVKRQKSSNGDSTIVITLVRVAMVTEGPHRVLQGSLVTAHLCPKADTHQSCYS